MQQVIVEWSHYDSTVAANKENQSFDEEVMAYTMSAMLDVMNREHGVFSDWKVEQIMRTYDDGTRTPAIKFERGYSYFIFNVKVK